MAYDIPKPGSLKRKRRRRADKPAISAKLYLDSSLKGEQGVLSQDLVDDLYPYLANLGGIGLEGPLYAAITPWTPDASPSTSNWAIVPFRPQTTDEKPLPPSSIWFPASARGTQSFVSIASALAPNRTLRQNSAVEVRINDVVPIPLETVFVSVDTAAVERLEEAQKRYRGSGVGANGYARNYPSSSAGAIANDELTTGQEEDTRKRAIHEALGNFQLVHTGDLVPIPLVHPVTRASAPPASIIACEPVAQGLLTANTRIVVVPSHENRKAIVTSRSVLSPRLDEESDENVDESTTDSFYSATDGPIHPSPLKPIVTSKSATDMSNSEGTLFDDTTEDDNLSSDEDDMISLAKPGGALGDGPSGINSARSGVLQRAFDNRANGISTPGSVFSHMSGSTIRGATANRSKVFRAQGLMQPIANEVLYPRPAAEEDEEARVYVDAAALARLGCFSGDWVRIESSEIYPLPHLSAFASLDARGDGNWRAVKVYGLPESMAKKPARYQLNPRSNMQRNGNNSGGRGSIASILTTSAPVAGLYLSPILLANLGEPSHVSISPLPKHRSSLKRPMSPRPGSISANVPPTASEVTLRKVVTPLSSERALNNLLFTNLKDHFERRQRVMKSGDLVAIPIDEALARSMYDGEEGESGATLSQWGSSMVKHATSETVPTLTGVAWFTVESVNVTATEDVNGSSSIEAWGGSAIMDTIKTTLRQSGDDKRKLPSANGSTWPFYLGIQKTAPASHVTPQSSMPEAPKSHVSALQRRLRELISISTSPRAVHLGMPPLAVLITSTQRSIGKSYVAQRVCADLGLHFFSLDAYDLSSDGSGSGADTNTQGLFEARCERALDCGPSFTAVCIKHVEQLDSDRMAKSLQSVLDEARVIIATTTDVDKVPDSIRGLFTHELEMSAPDEGEREGILRDVVTESGVPLALDIDLHSLAVKTAALVAGDLVDVVDRAITARTERLNKIASAAAGRSEQGSINVTLKDIQLSGGVAANALIPADFEAAVDLARKNFADSIGAPKIPNVQWSDVGGLSHVKDAVVETIQLPLTRPELFAKGLKKRSGILFYGPPGTGKTLLAKAIATEFSLNFFSVKGPELLNMYIGESEANVRRVFQRARDARPCVVFFDELDSVAPKRGNQGDSGGVMDRIVSQLLAELDGMSDGEAGGGGVFVIGATNRPDLLDQALLRPGRFDKMLYLGISDTHDKQETILKALTRKFTLSPNLSLARVAAALPFTFTGADLYALCSDAMLKAVTRSARLVDSKLAIINKERAARNQTLASVAYYFDHHATDEDTQVEVEEEDFMRAKSELVPSVSLEELRHYETVRNTFEGAAKKDDAAGSQGNGGGSVDAGGAAGGKVSARSRMMEAMRRATGGSGARKAPVTNGNSASNGEYGDDDDDYVIKTDQLSLNGGSSGSRPSSAAGYGGKGKGKGKSIANSFGNDADGEDLYD
ncbi:AAA-domain-containing protein [Polychaeton citri CBS 116435]|uniref:Peroxisomal ATPase PEX6 n=1 Tax=Polychaeton citri CBS 116435 TaxID=1314669 RepID=A0A9P4QCW7_9PEZI|nr:AAA-domain-containing protein [Polychaeton citri CBS 116435]